MEITVLRKDIKNAYIRIKPPDGRVVLSVPKRMRDEDINSLIEERKAWIERHRKRYEGYREPSYEYGSVHRFWGKDCVLEKEKAGVDLEGGTVYITSPGKEALDRLRRMELARALDRIVPYWMEKTGIRIEEWRIRDMSTRWGSCNILKGRIWIALSLTKYPVCCLEETVCHELMHMKVRDHGPAFKALMDEYYPSWREVKKLLR